MGVDYPEDHPLSMLCKEIVCKGLSPSKLAKSKIARMTELSKEVPENFREFQAKIRLDREVALKNAGLFDQDENDKNLTDEEKKKKEQEERELTIDECSFERLVEMGAIYSMDGDKLSDEDRDELKETVQLQQARKNRRACFNCKRRNSTGPFRERLRRFYSYLVDKKGKAPFVWALSSISKEYCGDDLQKAMKLLGFKPNIPLGWIHEISTLRTFHYIHKEVKRIDRSTKKMKGKARNDRLAEEYKELQEIDLYKDYAAIAFKSKRKEGAIIIS